MGSPLDRENPHKRRYLLLQICAAGLKTLLVEYLLMQNRHLSGEERNPKTRDEWRETNGGIPLLTDLCLAMRSDPLGVIRGLGEVVTCIYGRHNHIGLSGSSRGGILQYSGAREPDKRTRWNGVELVPIRGAEGTNESHSALPETKRS